MSSRRPSKPVHRPQRRRGRARIKRRRRLLGLAILVVAAAGIVGALSSGIGPVGDAVRQVTLPLKHEDVIRQQAADKKIDPALIAAMIYEESRFRDQTSHAGARGLMQITPHTADFIARDSGGNRFTQADLATPQVNIAYGAYYLRYLLRRYDQRVPLAVAAYNAGETNVDSWIARSGGDADRFRVSRDVPFAETRHYVRGVVRHRRQYAEHYAAELGLKVPGT